MSATSASLVEDLRIAQILWATFLGLRSRLSCFGLIIMTVGASLRSKTHQAITIASANPEVHVGAVRA